MLEDHSGGEFQHAFPQDAENPAPKTMKTLVEWPLTTVVSGSFPWSFSPSSPSWWGDLPQKLPGLKRITKESCQKTKDWMGLNGIDMSLAFHRPNTLTQEWCMSRLLAAHDSVWSQLLGDAGNWHSLLEMMRTYLRWSWCFQHFFFSCSISKNWDDLMWYFSWG